MTNCSAVQQSDEMFCAKCNLRWDVNDTSPPECRKSFPPPKSSDREKLEKVAQGYNDLMALQATQRLTMALMIRACITRLKSPDSRKRAEAIDALGALADQLEMPR